MYSSGLIPWRPVYLGAAVSLDAPGPHPWITQLIGSRQALIWEGSLTGVEGFIWTDSHSGAGKRPKCHLEGAMHPEEHQESMCQGNVCPQPLVLCSPCPPHKVPRREYVLAARTAPSRRQGQQDDYPPQESHRNVAEASAGKSHPLLPPSELPLFRSRKRMNRKGL